MRRRLRRNPSPLSQVVADKRIVLRDRVLDEDND